jgi:hypothetical protein
VATLSVKQSGGDYTSLAAAEAASANNDTIEISGAWTADDTNAVTISNTDITVQAVGDSKVNPATLGSPSHYRLRVNVNAPVIDVASSKSATFDGLEVKNSNTGTSARGITQTVSTNGHHSTITVKNCVIYAGAVSSNQRGTDFQNDKAATCYFNIENCIVFNWGRNGIRAGSSINSTSNINHLNINSCTILHCASSGTGVIEMRKNIGTNYDTHYVNVYNTIAMSEEEGGADFLASGTNAAVITWDIHNSIDSDNTIAGLDASAYACLASRTATDSAEPGAGDWVIFEDTTTSPYDLRLQGVSGCSALDAHTDNSGAGMSIPSTDIMGTSRPQGTNYDIGAFEHVASGGGGTFKPHWAAHATVTISPMVQ